MPPKFRLPARSAEHRAATLALYRALLTQCRALPCSITTPQRNELQNIVRNRFRQARHLHSIRRLRISFQAGYEAIDHLDAAVGGDEASRGYILDLLKRAPERVKGPPPLAPPLPRLVANSPPRSTASYDTEEKKGPSILDRPIPFAQLAGKRHIPVLFNANHIPVLRIKKPQPANLSGYLNARILKRQNQQNWRWHLNEEKSVAEREDEWDELLAEEAGVVIEGKTIGEERVAWRDAFRDAIAELDWKLEEEKRRNREMAVKMLGVVDRERALFEREKVERGRVRKEGRSEETGR